jgi:hypothetical protein
MAHRGKHSNDNDNFAQRNLADLQAACADLSYLLSHQYGEKSALQLVGNRYSLNQRQQTALGRVAVANEVAHNRRSKELEIPQLAQQVVCIDGYNLLIGVEVALSQGFLFLSQDGCYRDIASIHGTYRKVEETLPALHLIADALHQLQVKEAIWYFDTPVSNSGRLKTILYELATAENLNWRIELVNNPDKTIAESQLTAISSDGWVLDHSKNWFNLLAYLLKHKIKNAEIVDFLPLKNS